MAWSPPALKIGHHSSRAGSRCATCVKQGTLQQCLKAVEARDIRGILAGRQRFWLGGQKRQAGGNRSRKDSPQAGEHPLRVVQRGRRDIADQEAGDAPLLQVGQGPACGGGGRNEGNRTPPALQQTTENGSRRFIQAIARSDKQAEAVLIRSLRHRQLLREGTIDLLNQLVQKGDELDAYHFLLRIGEAATAAILLGQLQDRQKELFAKRLQLQRLRQIFVQLPRQIVQALHVPRQEALIELHRRRKRRRTAKQNVNKGQLRHMAAKHH